MFVITFLLIVLRAEKITLLAIADFERVEPLLDVLGELGHVLARYEPRGQVDDVVEQLVPVAGRRAKVAVATRAACAALVAHLALGEQRVVVLKAKPSK